MTKRVEHCAVHGHQEGHQDGGASNGPCNVCARLLPVRGEVGCCRRRHHPSDGIRYVFGRTARCAGRPENKDGRVLVPLPFFLLPVSLPRTTL